MKVKLLNGNEHKCNGSQISITIRGKTQDGSSKESMCWSQRKQQVLPGATATWEGYEKGMLGGACKKILFDPDQRMRVQARTEEKLNGFCPIKVELEILDIVLNTPRYFCSELPKQDFFKRNNNEKFVAKEGRCF